MKKKHLLKTLLVFLLFWFVEIASAQTAIFNSSMAITPYGSVNSPGGEMFGNIIDNNINTKFLDFTSNDGMAFTVFLGLNAKIASSITITTANDVPGRDPKNYEIFGSNDGSSFTSIATGDIGFITTRQFSRKYYFLNSNAYKYYRINFTNTWEPVGMMQLAEVQLYTCEVATSGSISANQTISGTTSSTPVGEANLNSGSSAQISPEINDYQCVDEYCDDMVNNYTPPHTAAQSFRTSSNVNLSAIKINVASIINTGAYTLRIFQGAGESGTELTNQAVSIFNSGTNTFLLNTPLALTSGQPYTFKLETRDGNAKFNWTYSSDSDYSNGSGYVDGSNNNGDFNFQLVYQNNVNWQNITLSNYIGGVQKWQMATDPSFPSPVDIASTSATLASHLIGDISQTTYFRAVVVGCSTIFSDSVTISVNPPITPTTFTIDGIIYAVTSANTVSVTNQNRLASGDITVPAQVTYNSIVYTVTSIINEAFSRCVGLTSIIIPNSVTSIGEGAFIGCTGLTSLTIPTSITSISQGTFNSCSSLTSVVIPSSVTSIGNNAFQDCSSLTSVTIPNAVTSIGYNAFNGCTGLTSVTIPNSVTAIDDSAFQGCSGLISVICNLTDPLLINASVFQGVTQASCSLTVPAASVAAYQAAAVWQLFSPISCITTDNTTTVTACGTYTWANNSQTYTATGIYTGTTTNCVTEKLDLTITVPPTSFTNGGINYVVTSATNVAVGNNAGASGDLIIPASVTTDCGTYAVTSIGDSAFLNRNGLTSVTIPNSVTVIGDSAFQGCSGLTILTIPDSVTSIGAASFYGCSGLTSVTISNSITSISANAFTSCSGLTSITIPDSVTSIGSAAFQSCSNLTYFEISNSITTISDSTFNGCSGLTSITIPDTVTSIGNNAFQGCSGLTSITIPNTVTSIGAAAFYNCIGLTSLIIPNLVTSIGQIAFSGCSGLTSVSIPDSVTTIGDSAFANCSSLYSVTVDWATPIIINSNVFNGLDLATISLNFPNDREIAYNNAAVWTNFHNSADIIRVFNYCKDAIAAPLPAPFPLGRTVIWYTDEISGIALGTAPTPSTTTVGTEMFFVSQVLGGVESALETVTVNTIALLETPAAITGNAELGTLVRTNNTTTYSIEPVIDAVSYIWTAPAGVNIVSGQGTTEITVNFADVAAGAGSIGNLSVLAINSNNCNSLAVNLALSKVLPNAPEAIKMTDATLPVPVSGIATAVTTFSQYMGTEKIVTLTATPVEGAWSYIWELPVGANLLSGATTTGGITTGTNVITVNLAGVTNSSTYSHTRLTGIMTHVLRFGVKAVTGVGGSITDNLLVVNPTTASTARLLTVFAAVPAASSAIRMTDADGVDSTKAITAISKFIGTNKILTLTAGLSATASSYRWELPTGVTQLSGGNSNVITIDFNNVPAGISSLYVGVIAVNGIGESTSVNSSLVPATTSTARLLRLTAGVPAAVSVVTGQLSGLCGNLPYSYAIRPSILANNYQITAPTGAVVRSDSNMSNSSNVLTTPDLNFTITYPSGFVSTPLLPKNISVRAINGVGSSTTSRVLSLSTLMPAIGTATGSAGITNFRRTGTQTFTIPAVLGATNYVWTVFDGAEIVSGQGTNLVEIDFKAVTKSSTKLSVIATNACGTSTVVKSYNLKVATAINARSASIEAFSFNVNEVYPVPVSSFFNVNITATTNVRLEISIYSLAGFAIMNSKSVQLKKGLNTITENTSLLKTGVYILQLTNPLTSEVITKKLIKE